MKEVDRFRQWITRLPLERQLKYQALYKDDTGKEAIWHRIYPTPFFEWFKEKRKGKKIPWDDLEHV